MSTATINDHVITHESDEGVGAQEFLYVLPEHRDQVDIGQRRLFAEYCFIVSHASEQELFRVLEENEISGRHVYGRTDDDGALRREFRMGRTSMDHNTTPYTFAHIDNILAVKKVLEQNGIAESAEYTSKSALDGALHLTADEIRGVVEEVEFESVRE